MGFLSKLLGFRELSKDEKDTLWQFDRIRQHHCPKCQHATLMYKHWAWDGGEYECLTCGSMLKEGLVKPQREE